MRFLFYVPQMAAYGGMERHVCSLAVAARERGCHVVIVTTSNSLGADLRDELTAAGVQLRELARERGKSGRWLKLAWLWKEALLLRTQSWDVIYTNGQSALAGVMWKAAGPKTRIVHHHHTAADPGEQKTWSPSFRRILATAPEVVGCSQATSDAINLAVGRQDARFLPYLTRCPVDKVQVEERPPFQPLRIGFLGRLIPEKGIGALCQLSLDPELADLEWHIHGAGPAFPPEHFAAYPRIVYHGAYRGVEQQARALLGVDMLVLLSTHNEGMPLSLLEGMSGGLPWVATDRGGTREMALSPVDAIVAPASATHEDLRQSVREMARRISAGETSRLRQREVYDRHFSPPVVSAAWLQYFESGARPA